MSSLYENRKTGPIVDPGNLFGKRPGGVHYGDALDPGGALIKSVTGSDIGRKIADPAKLFPQPLETVAETPKGPTASELATAKAKRDKLRRYGSLRAPRTILTTERLGG